ncbi:MAG: S8 family serine peptidase [Solirubrobacterales bacterium]
MQTDTVTAPDRVLSVQFKDDTTRSEQKRARKAVGGVYEQALAAPGLQQVAIPEGRSVDEAAVALRANPDVEFVELPGSWQADAAEPSDAYFWTQWGLNNTGDYFACKPFPGAADVPPCYSDMVPVSGLPDADIDAPEAWAIATTGSMPIAVIDTGVAYQHVDLAPNIYTDDAELNGTAGVDDDSDGYDDDVHGWDFMGDLGPAVDDPLTPLVDESQGPPVRQPQDNDPRDPDGHGTHVSSILGAHASFDPMASEPGIAGVDPRAQILPLRAADENGSFTWTAINQAVTYAIAKGVKVINGSFGGADSDSALEAIVDSHPEVLFVFSAGNGGGDHIGDDHDADHHEYPCDIPAPNVICVAATDWNDQKASFSDYGYDSVDIAAPGKAIFGAVPSSNDLGGAIGDFKFLDGTSMAAPMVSGAAALVWGANPALDSSQIKTLLVENSDRLDSLYGKVGWGGRLNVARAAAAAVANPPASGWPVAPPPPPPPPVTGGGGDGNGGGSGDPTKNDTTPPEIEVVRPKAARVGSVGKIRFRVHCDEACNVKVLARVSAAGLPALRTNATIAANRSRTLYVRFRGKRLQAVRSLLENGETVKVYFSVAVTDKAGNHGKTRNFTVRLAR